MTTIQYYVKVVANAKTIEVVTLAPTKLKVSLTESPRQGKANRSLIKVLAKHFNIPKSHISIISGETSRDKIIEITPNDSA